VFGVPFSNLKLKTNMIYQKLFNHLHEEHGLILIEHELQEIVNIVTEELTEPDEMEYPRLIDES
jgi:hypothetical protein